MRFKKTTAALMSLIMSAGLFSSTVLTANAEEPSILGDVHSDGIIDARDATEILSYYARTSSDYNSSFEQFVSAQTSGIVKAAKSSGNEFSMSNDSLKTHDEETKILGDINCDSIVDARDATSLLSYYSSTSTGYKGTLERFISGQTDDSGGYISSTDRKYILWLDISKDKDFVFNGKFIRITFKIKDGIPSKDYPLRIRTDLAQGIGNTVYPDKVLHGNIRVGSDIIDPINDPPGNEFAVYCDNISCKQGDTVDYYINICNNPGLVASLIWFYYDKNAMDVVSIEPVGEFAEIMGSGKLEIGDHS